MKKESMLTRCLVGGIVAATVLLAGQAGWAADEDWGETLKKLPDELVSIMKEPPTEQHVTRLLAMIREKAVSIEPDGSGSPADAAIRMTLSTITDYFGQPEITPEWRQAAAATYASFLTDKTLSPSARAFLCEQVRRLGGPAEIQVLALLMQDPRTLEAACGAIESIGGPAACAALRDALARTKDGPETVDLDEQERALMLESLRPIPKPCRARIIKALGVVGCEDAAPELKAFREDPDLRQPAREALCAMGDPDAAAWCLEDLVAAPDDAVRAAVTADLSRLAGRLRVNRPEEALKLARQMAASSHGPCRVAGVLLEAELIKDIHDRSAWLARRIREADAAGDPPLWGAILKAAEALPGDTAAKPWVDVLRDQRAPSGLRVAVVTMLARRPDETSRRAVSRAVGDKDPEVRDAAVTHMDGRVVAMASRALMKQALKAKEVRERRQAWDALSRTGDPAVRAMAVRALRKASAPQRVELLGFLGEAGTEEQADAVAAYIGAPDEATAVAALKALARLGSDPQWPMVLDALTRDQRESARNAAVDTLVSMWSMLDDAQREARARELVARFDPADVSTATVLAPLLARLDTPVTRDGLWRRGLLPGDVPEATRVAAAKALGREAPELAVELAGGLAKIESDAVREAVMDALVAMLRANFGRARGGEVLGILASGEGSVSAERRAALVKTATGAGMAGIEALVPLLEHPEWAGDAARVIADMVRGDNRRAGLREPGALDAARKALPLLDEAVRKPLEELLNQQATEKKP
ncbi:MAG: hypothetical protein KBH78_12120 [Candidatus Hydrogenedentes bacterium]|nr:hypothetical protein [Candidatus Hydrogenedentota bacterium]